MTGALRTGGCQCGAVRYEVAGEPRALFVCHCRECQKQSASAFGISLVVSAGALRVIRGATKTWSRPTDSGRVLDCTFCVACGSRLWHGNPARGTISVKGGSLDTPPDIAEATHIWTARKLPGVVIPEGARQFPGEPSGA
jgi:hypothetical protein